MQSQEFIFDNQTEWEVIDENVRRKILGYDTSIMMVKVEFKTGGVGVVHHHPHTQVTHVESGAFELTMGDETQLLKAGDAFFVPPNTPHGVVCKEGGVLIDSFSPIREDFL